MLLKGKRYTFLTVTLDILKLHTLILIRILNLNNFIFCRVVAAELPWGSLKVVTLTGVDFASPPGHFAVKSLLQELFVVFDRKIHSIEDGDIVSIGCLFCRF